MTGDPHTDWWGWVTAVAGTESLAAIAHRVSTVETITPAAVAKWRDGSRPSADNVRAFADAFGQSRGHAYVVAGYLEPKDVAEVTIRRDAESLSDDEVAREFMRRFRHLGEETGPPLSLSPLKTGAGRKLLKSRPQADRNAPPL